MNVLKNSNLLINIESIESFAISNFLFAKFWAEFKFVRLLGSKFFCLYAFLGVCKLKEEPDLYILIELLIAILIELLLTLSFSFEYFFSFNSWVIILQLFS